MILKEISNIFLNLNSCAYGPAQNPATVGK